MGGTAGPVTFGKVRVSGLDYTAQQLDVPRAELGALNLAGVVDAQKAGSGIARRIGHQASATAPSIKHLHPESQGPAGLA